MPYSDYTEDEICRVGQELYDRQIRGQVESGNRGKYLVLDIESGDYEIDADDLSASDRLLARMPDAVLYGVRVGFAAAYEQGSGLVTSP